MWTNIENPYDMLKTIFYYKLTFPWIFIASLKNVLQGKFYEIWCLNVILSIFVPMNYFFQVWQHYDNIIFSLVSTTMY